MNRPEPVASHGDVVAVAQRIADDDLFPRAQDVDRSELVARDRFAPLAEAGLFGIAAPVDSGGLDLDPATMRRLTATIAGGCGVTFFCWAQHHGVVRAVASSPNRSLRDRHLRSMCSGTTMGGTAFAHLRRPDRRTVTACRTDDGWRIDGRAPWATSWGVADVFTVAAETDDGEVVWALVGGTDQPGIVTTPLHLPVLAATGTVALAFDGLTVADACVVAVDDADRWRRADRHRAAVGQTGVLGVAERAIRLLADASRGDDDPASAAARDLGRQLDERWRADADHLAALDRPDERVLAAAGDHRAACLELGRRATSALLAAVGGRGMELDHPAQRLAREADFYVIQAQTTDGRAATLRAARI